MKLELAGESKLVDCSNKKEFPIKAYLYALQTKDDGKGYRAYFIHRCIITKDVSKALKQNGHKRVYLLEVEPYKDFSMFVRVLDPSEDVSQKLKKLPIGSIELNKTATWTFVKTKDLKWTENDEDLVLIRLNNFDVFKQAHEGKENENV